MEPTRRRTGRCLPAAALLGGLILSGCGGLIEPVLVSNRNMDRVRMFDPNQYSITFGAREDGRRFFIYEGEGTCGDMVTVPLEYFEYAFVGLPTVRGELNGRAYPFLFDTGCNPYVIVEDRHVYENGMPACFPDPGDRNNVPAIVIADRLKVGSLVFENHPCFLWKHHAQYRFLGLPAARGRDVMIPLNIMKALRFFEFDQIRHRLRFSPRISFEADDPAEWIAFPFDLQSGNLLLSIPIEDVEATWMLDTGANGQLNMARSLVERVLEQRGDFRSGREKDGWSFAPYAGGKREEKKFTARQVKFGDHLIRAVNASYEPDRDAFADEPYEGVIGFGFFKKTVMVLDFERGVMWVKKAAGSRFEE